MKTWLIATTLSAPLAIGALVSAPGCVPSDDDPLACRDFSCDHQSDKTFCDIDGVYPGTEKANECIAPPADDACNRAVACDDPATPFCTDDSMGTCVECTDNTHCTVDGESCDTRVGECTDEAIFTCTPGAAGDAACAAIEEAGDYCSDGDICVDCIVDDHCTENVAQGICDATLLECRGCDAEGDDCESGLCGTNEQGVCVDEGEIVYVSKTGTDAGGCGTLASPCLTIAEGLLAVTPTRNIVLVAVGEYAEHLVVTDKAATLVADGAVTLNPGLLGAQNILNVSATANITIDGFILNPISVGSGTIVASCRDTTAGLAVKNSTITGAEDIGLVSTAGCAVNIQDSTIAENGGIGISATGGSLTIERSEVSTNAGGGIDVSNATYAIVNSVIVENGTAGATGTDRGGVALAGPTAGVFEFNTLSGNRLADGAIFGSALTCSGAAVTASNNIIVSRGLGGPGLIVGNCTFTYSLVEGDTAEPGDGNLIGNPEFTNPAQVDYTIPVTSPAHDAADPAATLANDRNGNPRPVGEAHDMGAYEVQ